MPRRAEVLAVLLLAAAACVPPEPPPQARGAAPLDAGLVPLEAALEIQPAAGPSRTPLGWECAPDGAFTARARGPAWEAEVVLAPMAGGARTLRAAVRWLERAEVGRVALVLSWDGDPAAVGRSLRFAPVEGALRVERGTPLLVAAGGLVLAGGPGLAAARVERVSRGVRATLFLDDAAARPFSTFQTCFGALPGPPPGQLHLAWARFDPRQPHLLAPRAPRQVDQLEAGLFPAPEGNSFVPVVLERWPRGARAAVAITDHADRTDPEALRAVLWGDSDRSALRRETGVLGRGLKLTRTFFVHGRGGSLDNPESRALADDLLRAGSEVALHSITGERDTREEVRTGLADAGRWSPVTWIDHEPYTNCEAFSAQGWRDGGEFGIRDLLAEAGYRWVWASGDEGLGAPRVDDLLGGRPDEARAAIAPFPLESRLWLFRSSMFFAAPEVLAAALSDAELERLEAARGLFVAHTYLGPSVHTTHSPEHLARLAVRPGPGGRLVIDPALDAALARLEAHVRSGRLASLTWAEAGGRLRALGEVELLYRPDGAVEIQNLGAADLAGLTLSVPVGPEVDLALDGEAPPPRDDGDGGARIWLDLPAGAAAVLRAYRGVAPLPFLAYP